MGFDVYRMVLANFLSQREVKRSLFSITLRGSHLRDKTDEAEGFALVKKTRRLQIRQLLPLPGGCRASFTYSVSVTLTREFFNMKMAF
jgi:hypothetical protein